MINKDTFQHLLQELEFAENNGIFTKFITKAKLEVDFHQEKIVYPEGLKINEKQTCNFSANENFVVFECVHRLLEKDYEPESLELEPKWKLGHGASGGRADILVKDKNEDPLLIIECKTAGEEFDKEKKKMEGNGGQLFSYLRQEGKVKYLCLYASDYKDEKIHYQNAIVKIIDRKEDITAYKEGDESIKLYENATNNKELFEVWKETYNLYFHYNGIFESEISAYVIELKPLKKKDLKPFQEATNIFNIFMEILRHNNISDNANAFNRMLSLLLCKIVDEQKANNENLDFQIKEGEDTPENIQDRLQKLYAQGMKKYLGEEIVYFEDKVIVDIIKKYPKQTPIEKVEEIFRQIKYYTQNEFAIKEVHNKELFLQNARVLNEVIRMLQNYQIRYTKKNQFLGDFFEQLLAHGIKQSEGQFFTPIPIVRFIILSVGLDNIIQQKLAKQEKQFLPKILDYACGAGHFLTESIDELQKHIVNIDTKEFQDKKNKDVAKNINRYKEDAEWAKDYIFGIEKDYRLARTSQISCFVNGDGDANIIFGDGLEPHNRLKLKKKKFDVVITNPPYAIKSFKNYLNVGEENYQLFQYLTTDAKEIETLFIERTSQVLENGGKAGIVLPSSILSGGGIYEKARKLLLEDFQIKAISEFGGKTFGATGTNTVVLFLEKRNPDFQKDREYISEDLFKGINRKKNLEFIDSTLLLKKFVGYRNFELSDYQTFLNKQSNKKITQSEQWQEYKNWFDELTEIKNLKKKRAFQKLSEQEQKAELAKNFHEKILAKEQEKFYIFMLTLDDNYQSQQTIISKVTESNSLGYEFSGRKGSEGIKIKKDEKGNIQTVLYDETNYNNPTKINSYILKSYYDKEEITEIDFSLANNVKLANLTNMLDFSRVDFEQAISLTPQQKFDIKSKKQIKEQTQAVINSGYEVNKLENFIENIESGNRPEGGVASYTEGALSLGGEHISANSGKIVLTNPKYVPLKFYEENKKGILQKNDILLCKDGALTGKIALLKNELVEKKAMVNEHVFILRCRTLTKQKYIFNFLFSDKGQSLLKENITGSAQGGLNLKNLKNIKIPIPPLAVQQKIIDECEVVEQETEQARQSIVDNKKQIEEQMQAVINSGYVMQKLGDLDCEISKGQSITKENTKSGNVKVVAGGINYAYLHSESNRPKNTITISASGANAGYVNYWYEPIFASDCTTIRAKKESFTHYIYINLKFLQDNIFNLSRGMAQPHVYPSDIKNIKIPIPPLDVQKKLVAKVEKIEIKIDEAQNLLDNATKRKNTILKKYL